jgi:hypothetical protein
MTHLPPPPGASPTPPLAVPPGSPRPIVGRPRIWQAALVFVAFAVIAGGSCATFMSKVGARDADPLAFVFLATAPLAAGAFALLLFRLWRRRAAEAWPSLLQCLLIGFAGAVVSAGGCGGWVMTMGQDALLPVAIVFGAAFILGLGLAFGAGELFLLAVARLIFGYSKR